MLHQFAGTKQGPATNGDIITRDATNRDAGIMKAINTIKHAAMLLCAHSKVDAIKVRGVKPIKSALP